MSWMACSAVRRSSSDGSGGPDSASRRQAWRMLGGKTRRNSRQAGRVCLGWYIRQSKLGKKKLDTTSAEQLGGQKVVVDGRIVPTRLPRIICIAICNNRLIDADHDPTMCLQLDLNDGCGHVHVGPATSPTVMMEGVRSCAASKSSTVGPGQEVGPGEGGAARVPHALRQHLNDLAEHRLVGLRVRHLQLRVRGRGLHGVPPLPSG